MNRIEATKGAIATYEGLMSEKARLETLIENQKNIIRHDLDELKKQFKKEVRPAMVVANVAKKFLKPETRNATLLTTGGSLIVDFLLQRFFKGSNLLIRLLLPKLIHNYSTHLLHPRGQSKINAKRQVH